MGIAKKEGGDAVVFVVRSWTARGELDGARLNMLWEELSTTPIMSSALICSVCQDKMLFSYVSLVGEPLTEASTEYEESSSVLSLGDIMVGRW